MSSPKVLCVSLLPECAGSPARLWWQPGNARFKTVADYTCRVEVTALHETRMRCRDVGLRASQTFRLPGRGLPESLCTCTPRWLVSRPDSGSQCFLLETRFQSLDMIRAPSSGPMRLISQRLPYRTGSWPWGLPQDGVPGSHRQSISAEP